MFESKVGALRSPRAGIEGVVAIVASVAVVGKDGELDREGVGEARCVEDNKEDDSAFAVRKDDSMGDSSRDGVRGRSSSSENSGICGDTGAGGTSLISASCCRSASMVGGYRDRRLYR